MPDEAIPCGVDGCAIRAFQDRMAAWYRWNGRHYSWREPTASIYVRIVCEVLLQRTRADAVAGFAPSFLQKYPSWKKIASATENELQEELKPVGLWQRRASSLSRLAVSMLERKGRFPETRAEIEALPGVGQYIANAVLLFCHKQPQPLLDTNMARVLERHFGPRSLADIRYDPYLQLLSTRVVTCKDPISINWAILDLAALICTKTNPKHAFCPIFHTCHFLSVELHARSPSLE